MLARVAPHTVSKMAAFFQKVMHYVFNNLLVEGLANKCDALHRTRGCVRVSDCGLQSIIALS